MRSPHRNPPILPALLFASVFAFEPGTSCGQGNIAGVTYAHRPAKLLELPSMEVRVIGQKRWLRGTPAALRVIVTDHRTGAPIRAGVDLAMVGPRGKAGPGETRYHHARRTDGLGTLDDAVPT